MIDEAYEHRVTAYANHDNHHKHLDKKKPAHARHGHDAPPEQGSGMVARLMAGCGERMKKEEITEDEQDGRQRAHGFRSTIIPHQHSPYDPGYCV